MDIFEKIMDKRRDITDKLFKLPTDLLFKLKVSPNMLTFFSAFGLIISSYFLYQREFFYALLVLASSFIIDMFDGSLARRYKYNKYGFMLDLLCDNFFGSLLIASLYAIKFISFELLLLTLSSTFMNVILYIYYKLKEKENPHYFMAGISQNIFVGLIFPQFFNFVIIYLIVVHTTQTILNIKKFAFKK